MDFFLPTLPDHVKSFYSKFQSNTLHVFTTDNSEAYLSLRDSKKEFPLKCLWIIHSLHRERGAYFTLSTNSGDLLVELNRSPGPRHHQNQTTEFAQFETSSRKHPGPSSNTTEEIRVQLTILSARGCEAPTIIKSDWTNCKNRTIVEFYGEKTLPMLFDSETLFPTINFHGKDFKHVLLVGIEFDYVDKSQHSILTKEEHSHSIMKKLYNNLESGDVEIIVKFEQEDDLINEFHTKAHKAVLSANSEVFKTMLQSSFTENQLYLIEIDDFEPNVVQELLKYFYGKNVDFENYALDLLKISDKYDVHELLKECQVYIGNHIPKFGWKCIFKLLQTYENGVSILRDMVQHYYYKYESIVKHEPEFVAAVDLFPGIFFSTFYYFKPNN